MNQNISCRKRKHAKGFCNSIRFHLFQPFLCRSDLVKCLVFPDHAGRFRGGPLEVEFGVGKKVGVLGLQVPCGHATILGFYLNTDAVAACPEGRNHRCAGTAERIKDGIAGK